MAKGFGAMCCVYDDDLWLETMVEGCYRVPDRLFFLVAARPWNGDPGSNETTLKAIRRCHDPDRKITVVEGDWKDEADERNAGLDLCSQAGLSFCLVIDSDEIYDPVALDLMCEVARLQQYADAWSISQVTYWKSYRYKIDSADHNGQLTIVRIGSTRFVNARRTSAEKISYLPQSLGVCHHLSYVRSDDEVKKKMVHSSHARAFLPNWYANVWLRWDVDKDLENLHPMRPQWYPRAIVQDPEAYPPALRRLYEKESLGSAACPDRSGRPR